MATRRAKSALIKELCALSWPRDRARVEGLQSAVAKELKIVRLRRAPGLVAGVDAAFFNGSIVAAACLYTYPGLEPLCTAHAVRKVTFPYIPGLLSLREGPAFIDAISTLAQRPDVVLFDGQGIAHPRGLGIAAFVGTLIDIPSIGCAKSRLVGEYDEPGALRGSRAPLRYKGRVVGTVLRTRDNVKPLFVSPGHCVDVEGSVEVVMNCVGRYRLAEPVRRADMLSRELKRSLAGTYSAGPAR